MVKLRLGGGVVEMSGSMSGNTFARNKGGQYMRARITPLNPDTSFQQTVRNLMSTWSQYWRDTLTQANRDAWDAFAEANPYTDVFGETRTYSGQQMFLKLRLNAVTHGVAIISDAPPASLAAPTVDTLSITADIGAGSMSATYTSTGGGVVILRATPGISPGKSYVKNLYRDITNAAGASPYDYETDWTTRFGALPAVGQKISVFAFAMNNTTGAVSVGRRADAIVVST